MTRRTKLVDMFEDDNQLSGQGLIGDGSAMEEFEALVDRAVEDVEHEQVAGYAAETIRALTIRKLPSGANEALAMLVRLGIELPEPTIPPGATLDEVVAADLTMLNLMLGKALVNLQFQASMAENLKMVEATLNQRLVETLSKQRQEGDKNRYQLAMAAIVGGDPKGGFRFSVPESYHLPQGWEQFTLEAAVERQAAV